MIEPKETDCLTWICETVRTLPGTAVYGLSVVRNEIDRLPYLLDYYRSIGVEQFLFVSDHSDDGTTEYLLEQSDCAVFLPNTSFKDSRCGVDWQVLLLDLYCRDAWVITFDADEILTYPYAETLSLPGLCPFLDEEGANAVGSFLLDMYSDGPVRSAIYRAPAPFLSTSSLFDKDYQVLPAADPKGYVPSGKVIGGPRARLFYPFQNRHTVFSRAAMYAGERAPKIRDFVRGPIPLCSDAAKSTLGQMDRRQLQDGQSQYSQRAGGEAFEGHFDDFALQVLV